MQELRRHTRAVMRAFLRDIAGKKVSIAEVEASIDDANALHELLELRGGDLAETTEAIRESLKSSGQLTGRFDPNSQAAMQFISSLTAELVADINAQQKEAIREIVAAGRTLGENSRTIALDIVGRVSPNGRREGGIVGLSGPQAQAVANARINLRSGDPEQMRKYLQNTKRDARFDATVKRYIDQGKPVPQRELSRIIARYEARLLQTRGETIARTEAGEAVSRGGFEAVKQQIENNESSVRYKMWSATGDGNERDEHEQMDGAIVEFDDPFVLPDGTQMLFPRDTTLGADAGQVINCRCTVLYLNEDEARERGYH